MMLLGPSGRRSIMRNRSPRIPGSGLSTMATPYPRGMHWDAPDCSRLRRWGELESKNRSSMSQPKS